MYNDTIEFLNTCTPPPPPCQNFGSIPKEYAVCVNLAAIMQPSLTFYLGEGVGVSELKKIREDYTSFTLASPNLQLNCPVSIRTYIYALKPKRHMIT